jgi:solute carrier family 35 protein C2
MDPVVSGHRRRRSSQMSSQDTSAKGKSRRTSSPTKGDIIPEDPKLETASDGSASEDVELDDLSDDDLQDDEETGLTGKDKGRRRKKRHGNTLMDQRIAGEVIITEEEKREADQNVVKKALINGLLIGLWYLFSLSISIVWSLRANYRDLLTEYQYNKWMFDPEHLDFHFPLFTTCFHMLVQFSLASLVLFFLPRFRPRYDSISNPKNTDHISDEDIAQHEAESKKPLMTRMFYFTRIGPCGMATGLDIGLGNMSLKFITLTFYSKNSNPPFHINADKSSNV